MPGSMVGRRVIVAMPGTALGLALATGLQRHGAQVLQTIAPFESRAAAGQAIDEARRGLGGADVVVHAGAMPAALRARPLDELSAGDWQAAVHRSMLASLYALQAAHAVLRERGGSVVLVGPCESLVGAPGLVPLMTLAEGQRSLMKSAARQWGAAGIRLNWVGVAGSHYAPELAQAAFPLSPELGDPPPPLGEAPAPHGAVADVVAWLSSDAARGLTGATLNLDGGDWMVP